MSKTWDGGKGDEYRKVDVKIYRDNYENIDFSSMRNKQRIEPLDEYIEPVINETNSSKRFLLLDDIRQPEHCQLHDEGRTLISLSGIAKYQWEIVRSYKAFVDWIDTHGIPDVVSYDNDLSEYAMTKYCDIVASGGKCDENSVDEKQGIHCAHYLVEKCKELNVAIPVYYVHSANFYARPMIREIMEQGKL